MATAASKAEVKPAAGNGTGPATEPAPAGVRDRVQAVIVAYENGLRPGSRP